MTDRPFADLRRLFAPAAVAVVGASDDTRKIGGRVLDHLQRNGYGGRIIPVNPKRDVVQGMPAVGSIDDLPDDVDLAILALPASGVVDAIEACGRRGCRFALIFAAGFSEAGADGAAMQALVSEAAARSGVYLLGPNSLGLISGPSGLAATFASVLDREPHGLLRGRAALVSQSGAFGAYIYGVAQDQDIGIGHFVSVGNEAGLTVADFVAHLADDAETQAIGVYLEGVRDGERFLEAAGRASAAGKDIAVLKVGTSERAQRAIASHTAALVGSDASYDAAFARVGVTRVESVQDMLDFLERGDSRVESPAGTHRVGILTLSGGAGAWASDELVRRGLDLADLSAATKAELEGFLPGYASAQNPVDCTAQILQEPELLGRCMEVLAKDPSVDSVLLLMGLQERDGAILAADIADAAARAGKPVVVAWMAAPTDALALLRDAPAVELFEDFERGIRWLAASARSGRPQNDWLPTTDSAPHPGLELPVSETTAKAVLEGWGVPIPAGRTVTTQSGAVEAAREVGYPVALKGQAPDIAHKTELGLVALGLASDDDVVNAFDDLWERLAGAAPTGDSVVLVERMAPGGVDVIIGSETSTFGPILMFGLGGINTELLKDVVFRLAPVSLDDAREMINAIRGAPMLRGYRGAPAADCEALARAIVCLGDFAVANAPKVTSVEVNPLRVLPEGQGVVALDALIT